MFMNPAVAVTFILSGFALWLLQSSDIRRVRIARACAAVILLFGLFKLCAITGFFDLDLDGILFADRLFEPVTGLQNRVAANTAFNFFLFGAALLLFNVKSRGRDFFPAHYPLMLVLLTSFATIISYLFGTRSFYVMFPYTYVMLHFTPMAIHTSISFLLLAGGLLCVRPQEGLLKELFSHEIGGQSARWLFPVVVIIPSVIGWLQMAGQKAGFYPAEFGYALLAVGISVVLGLIVLSNARSMNNVAAKRTLIEKELSASKSLLSKFVTHTPAAVAADVASGIEAGANDYLTKPFHREELRVRVEKGVQMLAQAALFERVNELEAALEQVKQLQGIVPMCSYCRQVRNDDDYWQKVEGYISDHTDIQFSHGICPDCYIKVETDLNERKDRKQRD